jgi:hypothetical protein
MGSRSEGPPADAELRSDAMARILGGIDSGHPQIIGIGKQNTSSHRFDGRACVLCPVGA